MTDYTKDLEICQGASVGPWDNSVGGEVDNRKGEIGDFNEAYDAKFCAHFDPPKVMAMIAELQAKDERIEELGAGLVRIIEIEDELHGGDWDEIDHARNIAREILK